VLARLRGDATCRRTVDPGLAGGLRAWLEDGVAHFAPTCPSGAEPLLVDARSLRAAFGGAPLPPAVDGNREITVPLARGAMVGTLFRQLVVTGRIGDPASDALDGLEAGGSEAIASFVRRLPAGERAVLVQVVAEHAQIMRSQWSAVAPAWLPKVGERMSAPLAGGGIVLFGATDLVLGAPSGGLASVCLVDVRSGARRPEHRGDRCWIALLETLRSGAVPFRVATYYSATGEIDIEDTRDELLASTVQRTIEGISLLSPRTQSTPPADR